MKQKSWRLLLGGSNVYFGDLLFTCGQSMFTFGNSRGLCGSEGPVGVWEWPLLVAAPLFSFIFGGEPQFHESVQQASHPKCSESQIATHEWFEMKYLRVWIANIFSEALWGEAQITDQNRTICDLNLCSKSPLESQRQVPVQEVSALSCSEMVQTVSSREWFMICDSNTNQSQSNRLISST